MARAVSPIRNFDCPKCGAASGNPCTYTTGTQMSTYHKERQAVSRRRRRAVAAVSVPVETPQPTQKVETATEKAERLEKEIQQLKANIVDIYRDARVKEDWCRESQARIAEKLQKVGIEVHPVDGYLTIKFPVVINRGESARLIHDWGKVDMSQLNKAMAEVLTGGEELDIEIPSAEEYKDAWGTYSKHLGFQLDFDQLVEKIEVEFKPV